jgi:putative transposase
MAWCTKNCQDILCGEVVDWLEHELKELALKHQFTILEATIRENHVILHLDCSPQHVIPNVIKAFKGATTRALFKKHPELKENLIDGALWNPSYYVGTVNDETEDQIRRYIEKQEGKFK